ncbi:MAG: cytosine deaminase [Pseudomonadota bacterium]
MAFDTLSYLLSFSGDAPRILRNARLPEGCTPDGLPAAGDGLLAADLEVGGGRVIHIERPGVLPARSDDIDLEQSMVWPCPVDCHTHIDKGLVWARSPNRTGRFEDASVAARDDAARYQTREDFRARAQFALETAHAHGTRAIRSHVDAGKGTLDDAMAVLGELAVDWAGRIDLQLCPFTGLEEDPAWLDALADRAAARPERVLSVFLEMFDGLDRALDDLMARAKRHDLALDFHADENLDPGSKCLEAAARAVLRNRFDGRVLAGHCCALSVQAEPVLRRTLDLVADAGIHIVSLPLCNAYLLDRGAGKAPRHRGFAPVHEMRARGIPVSIASDNVRDAYYAYGDYDLPELFRTAVRMMQLDHPFGDWARAVTATPAGSLGLADAGALAPGVQADLIIFRARNWGEFVSRTQADRLVMRSGRLINTVLPDYRELDHLEGMAV